MNAITVNCKIVILCPTVLLTWCVYFNTERNLQAIREIKEVRQKGASTP